VERQTVRPVLGSATTTARQPTGSTPLKQRQGPKQAQHQSHKRRCKILEGISLDEWPVGATPGEKAQFLDKIYADQEKGDEMFSREREEEINASAVVSDFYLLVWRARLWVVGGSSETMK
jgi:hypothetical protein